MYMSRQIVPIFAAGRTKAKLKKTSLSIREWKSRKISRPGCCPTFFLKSIKLQNNCFVVFWFWSSENMDNPSTHYLRQSHIRHMILKIINTQILKGHVIFYIVYVKFWIFPKFCNVKKYLWTHLFLRTINGCESSINIIYSSLFEVKRTHMRT